jgi:LuxR family maltose regulon positive regulatory protein
MAPGEAGTPLGPEEPATGLLEAKLVAPRARPEFLARPRLFRPLDASASRELTLLTAQAGFGKTVLVQSWSAARPDAGVAWVSLDAADDDPVYLWTYIAAAVDRIQAGLGRTALVRLRTIGTSVQNVVDDLINRLMAASRPIVIVLDDLHSLVDESCISSIERAIIRLPPHVRIVATTRSDPPMRLGRLRGRGALAEIRSRDLAFTVDEARQLLVEREGIRLGKADIELLVERTEGWPAGLYLAALWLRDLDDPGAGVRDFGGDQRHVADYLHSEVIDAIPSEQRSFLLQTSVLGRFTAELSDSALGRNDSAAMIAEIERSNLFLVNLDGRRNWYRYHSLFAELLGLQLKRSDPSAPADLHRRAAAWCRKNGLILDAIEHEDAAGNLAGVAQTLADHHLTLLRSGAVAAFLRWVQKLPPTLLSAEPVLAMAAAVAAGQCSRPASERRRLLRIAEGARDERADRWTSYLEGAVAMIKSEWIDGDVGEAVRSGRRAVELTSLGESEIAVAALAALAQALYLAGDRGEARSVAQEAVDRPDAPERPGGLIAALAVLSLLDAEQHHLRNAEATARRAIEVTEERGLADTFTAGSAHLALGSALAAGRRFKEAARAAEHGASILREKESSIIHTHACLVLGEIRVARGDLARASADLLTAREEIAGYADPGCLPALADRVERALEAARGGSSELVEIPSEAELSVLRLLATDLSLREIGGRLFRSLNTVKTQTRELYRKLGVSSRADAVRRAAALDLVDTKDHPGDRAARER